MFKKSYVKGELVEYDDRETSDLVFIDAGAREGEIWGPVPGSGTFFTTEEGVLRIDEAKFNERVSSVWMPYPFDMPERDWTQAEIHLFEPNDDYHTQLLVLGQQLSHFCTSVTVHGSAAWSNNQLKFITMYESGLGSTLLDREGEQEGSKMVNCIDFKEFLMSLPGNDVHIKMDIEGAEYPVLGQVLNNSICVSKLSSLSIEWHRDLFPEEAIEFWRYRGQQMINAMKRGVMINWWPGEL